MQSNPRQPCRTEERVADWWGWRAPKSSSSMMLAMCRLCSACNAGSLPVTGGREGLGRDGSLSKSTAGIWWDELEPEPKVQGQGHQDCSLRTAWAEPHEPSCLRTSLAHHHVQ